MTAKFKYWMCTGRLMFTPLNNEAKLMCYQLKKKNLLLGQLESYLEQGNQIELVPVEILPEHLKEYVI